MLFRRECSKINRGLSCRCSIGEFGVVLLYFAIARGGGGGGEVIVLLGVWGDMCFMEIWPAAVEEEEEEEDDDDDDEGEGERPLG